MKGTSHIHVHAPKQETMDKAAIFLSALCLVHCTLLPLGLAALQAYGTSLTPKSLDNDAFHVVFAFVLLAVGGFAFVTGYLRHRRAFPLVAGILGTALLFVGAFNPGELLPEAGEHGITVLGTLVLLVAHAKNRRPGPLFLHRHSEDCLHGESAT